MTSETTCRICWTTESTEDILLIPCKCKGTQRYIHSQCWAKAGYHCRVCAYLPQKKPNYQEENIDHVRSLMTEEINHFLFQPCQQFSLAMFHRKMIVAQWIVSCLWSNWIYSFIAIVLLKWCCQKLSRPNFSRWLVYIYIASYVYIYLFRCGVIVLAYGIMAFSFRFAAQRKLCYTKQLIDWIIEVGTISFHQQQLQVVD